MDRRDHKQRKETDVDEEHRPEPILEVRVGGFIFDGPGGKVKTQKNHHLTKNVFIGETKADGQFKILKEYKDVFGEPFLKGTFKAKEAKK